MMQNCAGVSRKGPAAFPTQPLLASLLHRFELWTVLECHAVAQLTACDLRSLTAILEPFHQHALNPADWPHLELRLHTAITRQAGNPLLAQTVEHIATELQAISTRQRGRSARRPGTLWLLQCQHRKILSCIEAGEAEDAVRHTRAHLHLMRDQLMAALSQQDPLALA
jgi:DNA-binding FadR family transcriptional regulator